MSHGTLCTNTCVTNRRGFIGVLRVVVYGVGLFWFVPGVLTYPLIYDSGVTML